MSTNSVELPDELPDESKLRTVALAEEESAFVRRAIEARASADAGAESYSAETVHAWVRAKLRGEPLPPLEPVKRSR